MVLPVHRAVVGRRRVLLAAAVLLLGAAVAVLAPAPRPVYYVEGNLLFITPHRSLASNALRVDDPSAVLFAAAVERQYNVRPIVGQTSSATTLAGAGVRDGVQVSVPTAGGQWNKSFDRPSLRIEVVAGDPDTARARFDGAAADLGRIARQRQQEAGVRPDSMVSLVLAPAAPAVTEVGGSRSRSAAGTLLLVLLLSLGASTLVRRRDRTGDAHPEGDVHLRPAQLVH